MTAALETLLTGLRARLEVLYGERLAGVYLYGSQARGDATSDSDVDVLVVLEGEVRPGLEIRRIVDATDDLVLDSGEYVSMLPLSLERFRENGSVFVRQVRREAVPV